MERHRCRLCLRKFANGRALGGHMRSHVMSLHVPPKKDEQLLRAKDSAHQQHQNQELISDEEFDLVVQPSSSSSSSEEEENRENLEKNKGLLDPDFCSAIEGGSVVLQDRESESESSKNQSCRRSKRERKSRISETYNHQCSSIDQNGTKVPKCAKLGKANNESASHGEPEPESSISDISPDEDGAYCLMMLSRDKWVKEEEAEEDRGVDDDHKSEDLGVVKVTKARSTRRGKYRCETCNKVFRSYQALGGHRASHKKIQDIVNCNNGKTAVVDMDTENAAERAADDTYVVEEKIHECPVCYRVFASGQALGGHKRSHCTNNPATNANATAAKPFSRMIDLNLPAPLDDGDGDDDDEISQMEVSAVSDAEFVNPIWV